MSNKFAPLGSPLLLVAGLSLLTGGLGCGTKSSTTEQAPPNVFAPVISTQPASTSVSAGSPATFTATANGLPQPALQWQRSDDAGQTWSPVTGATGVTCTVGAPTVSDNNARFRLLASNSLGATPSQAATLTVTAVVGQTTAVTLAPQSTPTGIATGPDGNIWFTNQSAGQIGTIPALTHVPSAINLSNTACMPTGITAGPDGRMWFTEQATASIGVITLDGKTINEYAALGNKPTGITTGPDGAVWYTLQGGNAIGRMTPSGAAVAFPLATPAAGPQGIALGAVDGNLWFTETAVGQIAQITPGGALDEWSIPVPTGGVQPTPQGIVANPDGTLWFTDAANNQIVKFTPPGVNGTPAASVAKAARGFKAPPRAVHSAASLFKSVALATGSNPVGLTLDNSGNVWVANQGTSTVTQVTPDLVVNNYTLPTGSSGSANVVIGADGSLYVTQPGSNSISQVTTAPPAATVSISVAPSTIQVQAGLTVQFSDQVTGSPNTAANWTIVEGAAGGTVTATGLYTAPLTAGTYHVQAQSQSDTTKTDVATVTVTSVPAPTLTSFSATPATVTTGGTVTFTGVFGNGIAVITPGGLGLASGGTATASVNATTTYTLTVTNAAGVSVTRTALVTAVAAPTTPVVTAPANVTAGATGLTASVPAQVGNTYAWTITGGAITAGSASNAITFSAGASGSVQLSCVVSNAAGAASKAGTATCAIFAAPSATITAPANVTANATGLAASVPAQANSTFVWTISGGAITAGAGSNAITFTAGASGSVSLGCTVTNGAGQASAPGSATCAIFAAPNATITAPANVTASATGLAATVPAQAGSTFVWTISGGVITAGAGSNAITFTAGTSASVSLGCTVTNGAGLASAPGAATCAISPVPVSAFTLPANVTAGASGLTVSVPPQVGSTFVWTISGGVITAGAGSNAITFTTLAPGTLTLTCTVTNGAGAISASGPVTSTIVLGPVIASFTSTTGSTGPGGTTQLIAVFSGGTGVVDQGVGAISVGTPVTTPALTATTTFTLTVTNAAGLTATAQTQMLVGELSVLAGGLSGVGSLNGTGAAARFAAIEGMVYEPVSGLLYLADATANQIRRINPVTGATTTPAGSGAIGSVDGTQSGASFYAPYAVAVDASGYIYVADTLNNTIRKIKASTGVVTTIAGNGAASSIDNPVALSASFYWPNAIAVDAAGNVYVGEWSSHKIRKISTSGAVTTLAGGTSGFKDGTGAAARFGAIKGLAVDASGNLYAADANHHAIRKITQAGVVTTVAGNGTAGHNDGPVGTATFNLPYGLSVDPVGNIYVADRDNSAIRMITPTGMVSTLAGTLATGNIDGPALQASFYYPNSVAVGPGGTLYVGDGGNHAIRAITSGTVSTVAGTSGVAPGSLNGTGSSARFFGPLGVRVDGQGNTLVADSLNNTIRKITPAGVVSTFAGSGVGTYADGPALSAAFAGPTGVALDTAGNAYVADANNNLIRKVALDGTVSTLAGTLNGGYANGAGVTAAFSYPVDLGVDAAGNVYVVDNGNNMIRKVAPDGTVSTLAGTGAAGQQDGPGASATFNSPWGVAVAPNGTVYVADSMNNVIRQITPAGMVSTLAGSGLPGSGDGQWIAATFSFPQFGALDAAGNLYVTDYSSGLVRRVTPAGVVSTLVGTPGQNTLAMGPLPARLAYPQGVAVDPTTGNLVLAVESAILTVGWPGSNAGVAAGPQDITTPTNVTAGSTNAASVQAQPDSTYVWTLTGGSITGGQGTNEVTYTANGSGTVTLTCTVTNEDGTTHVQTPATSTIVALPTIQSFLAGQASLGPNGTTTVTAAFSGGTATVDHGVGALVSGVGVPTPALPATTTFTLTVTNSAGAAVTAQCQVLVGEMTVYAGVPSGLGAQDGNGASAAFSLPTGVAVDGAGNAYVADWGNGTIRKIDSARNVTTFAGRPGYLGLVNGPAATASFSNLKGVALGDNGNLYVADTANHVIRAISSSNMVTTLAGTGTAGFADGPLLTAQFWNPSALVEDGSGNIYVADPSNHRVRVINTVTGQVSTLAGSGTAGTGNGVGAAASFKQPYALALDGAGNLLVADRNGNQIRMIDLTVTYGNVTTLAGTGAYGTNNGLAANATFEFPAGLAVTGTGGNLVIYVADSGSNTIRTISASGNVATLAGTANVSGSANGQGTGAFFTPMGLAVDGSGLLYVADSGNSTIRKVNAAGLVSTLAGSAGLPGSSDGTGANGHLNNPNGIKLDAAGNAYLADSGNNTIRKIAPGGVMTTLAGTAGVAGSADLNGTSATFSFPMDLALDSAGNIFVADNNNSTIRKIDPLGNVTTFAGQTGNFGYGDGTGTGAIFNSPQGIAVDTADNLYVTDWGNYVIRMITPQGVVTTYAGIAGIMGSVDSAGGLPTFSSPFGIIADTAGNLYVSEIYNNTIRKIAPGGVVTTLAGTAGVNGNADGLGAAASFLSPAYLTLDGQGNLLVADYTDIRRISQAGQVTTVVGTALPGLTLPGPLPASLATPYGVAFDRTTGNLMVSVLDAILTVSWPTTANGVTSPLGINTPTTVTAGSSTYASVSAQTDSTYVWSIAGGTIASGQGSNLITYIPDTSGTVTLTCTTTTEGGVQTTQSITVATVMTATGVAMTTRHQLLDASQSVTPQDLSLTPIQAYVPNGSGGFLSRPGSGTAGGTFHIPGVPSGQHYWLQKGTDYVWTAGQNLDLGTDVAGRANTTMPVQSTLVNLNLTNMTPWSANDMIEWVNLNSGDYYGDLDNWQGTGWVSGTPNPGDTALATVSNWLDNVALNWGATLAVAAEGDQPVIAHLATQTGPGPDFEPYNVITDVFTTSGVTMVDGSPTTVTGAFSTPASSVTVDFDMKTLDFTALLPQMNPGLPGSAGFTQVNAFVDADGLSTALASGSATPDLMYYQVTDLTKEHDLGLVTAGNPYPGLPLFAGAGVLASVPFTAPGASTIHYLNASASTRQPFTSGDHPALTPSLGPVQMPKINGQDLFAGNTNCGTTPTLSWQAPALGAPGGYTVSIYEVSRTGAGGSKSVRVARLLATVPTLQVPPAILVAGHTYILQITAVSAAGMNWEATPYRNLALYESVATIVTGLISPTTADLWPRITSPGPQSCVQPGTATFTAAATGSGTLTYQWWTSTNGGATWTLIPGATQPTYQTPATTVVNDGNLFQVMVTNYLGTNWSVPARLTVTLS